MFLFMMKHYAIRLFYGVGTVIIITFMAYLMFLLMKSLFLEFMKVYV